MALALRSERVNVTEEAPVGIDTSVEAHALECVIDKMKRALGRMPTRMLDKQTVISVSAPIMATFGCWDTCWSYLAEVTKCYSLVATTLLVS